MSGAASVLLLYVLMVWTEKTLPFLFTVPPFPNIHYTLHFTYEVLYLDNSQTQYFVCLQNYKRNINAELCKLPCVANLRFSVLVLVCVMIIVLRTVLLH